MATVRIYCSVNIEGLKLFLAKNKSSYYTICMFELQSEDQFTYIFNLLFFNLKVFIAFAVVEFPVF